MPLKVLAGLAVLLAAAGGTIFCLLPGAAHRGQGEPRAAQPAVPIRGLARAAARPSPHPVADVEPKPAEGTPEPVEVGEVRRFEGSAGGVGAVAFAPDGARMISGGADGLIRLWDVAGGEELRRFEGHTGGVTGLDFAPDGRRILSGSDDGTVRLWNVEGGKELVKLEGHAAGVSHVRFSPDGRLAASGSRDHTARVWNLGTGRQVHSLEHGDYVVGVAFSPDGHRLATGSWDRTVRLWDVETGREVRRFEGHADKAGDVAFAPDGHHVLSSSTDGTLRLWDVETGREVSRCEVGADAGWAVAADGRRALSVRGAGVVLWNLATTQPLHVFEGHGDQVTSLAFAPDGRTALSGSRDGTARLWGLPSETGPSPVDPRAVARGSGRPAIEGPDAPSRKALVQAPRERPSPAPAKGGNAEDTPKAPRSAEVPGPAPPREFETVKLDNGAEVQVEKWGKTYPAYEYHPPLDILDRRVQVVLDSQRDGVPQ